MDLKRSVSYLEFACPDAYQHEITHKCMHLMHNVWDLSGLVFPDVWFNVQVQFWLLRSSIISEMVLVKNMATISCTCHPPNGSQFITEKIFQPHEEKGYLLPTWAWKINLLTFRLNAPVVFQGESERSPSLEVNSKVGEDCSSLPASSRSPATRDFQHSILVKALLWGCHLDVQAPTAASVLYHESALWPPPSLAGQTLSQESLAHETSLLPVNRVVVLPCMLCYSWHLHHPPLTASQCSFSLISSLCLVSPM